MKRSDLDTATVLAAVADGEGYTSLCERFPHKIVLAAFEREIQRGNLEYGVSVQTAWLTPQGREQVPGATDRTDSVAEIRSALRRVQARLFGEVPR